MIFVYECILNFSETLFWPLKRFRIPTASVRNFSCGNIERITWDGGWSKMLNVGVT